MSTPRTTLRILLCLAAAPWALPAADIRGSAGIEWAQNVSRSSAGSDWQDALVLRAGAMGSISRQIDKDTVVVSEASAELISLPKYERQQAADLGLRVEARRKFGLGPMAPSVSVAASATGRLSAMSGEQGVTTLLNVTAAKRLTESWRVAISSEWKSQHANADQFDASHRRVGAEIAWDITDRWQLTYGLGELNGNFTAHASPAVFNRALTGLLGSAVQNYYSRGPFGVTNSFGEGWFSHLVSGRVRNWYLQLSPALSSNTSLALRYENNLSTNLVGRKYRQDVMSATVIHRF